MIQNELKLLDQEIGWSSKYRKDDVSEIIRENAADAVFNAAVDGYAEFFNELEAWIIGPHFGGDTHL